MGRPRKTADPLTHRLQVLVTDAELAAIDDWMFSRRVIGRSEALRQLVARGLTVPDEAPAPPPKKRHAPAAEPTKPAPKRKAKA